MNWKGARRPVVIAGEGQPTAPMIAGNYDPLCMQGLVQSVQLPRRHGEVETPTSNQPPRGSQGRRLLGPPALCSCPFASLHGQVRARLGPGGYCQHSGNGGPQTCLPAACGVAQRGAQDGPSSPTQTQDPREGPSLAGRMIRSFPGTASSGWLARRRRDQGGVPHEVPMTLAMRTKGASRAPARAVSSFPLWCKGSKRRREHQAKAPVSVQRDQDQSNGREEVIVEPKPASPPEPFAGEDQL